MDLEFGQQVVEEAKKLSEQGRDANQTAKVLFDRDPQGANYGIGIILTGEGKAARTSSTLIEYTRRALEDSDDATYFNSAKYAASFKESVLSWQRIDPAEWDNFLVATPSDAGTGAVKSAVDVVLMQQPQLQTLGVEELGWPAYKTMAKISRVGIKEFPSAEPMTETGVLPLYQAGPLNTTGEVQSLEVIQKRAEVAAKSGDWVILDRAYSGFEFAHQINEKPFDDVIRQSYELQLKPFIDAKAKFLVAVSPTKALLSFALRPCGILLAYVPDAQERKKMQTDLNLLSRSRGSSFEHPSTRGFIQAMVEARHKLEGDHKEALRRVADAQAQWQKLTVGTPMAGLFTEQYAGLFRNPKANPDAAQNIYGAHLYPVFAQGRCRLNITGVPDDEGIAKEHVQAFAQQCFL